MNNCKNTTEALESTIYIDLNIRENLFAGTSRMIVSLTAANPYGSFPFCRFFREAQEYEVKDTEDFLDLIKEVAGNLASDGGHLSPTDNLMSQVSEDTVAKIREIV